MTDETTIAIYVRSNTALMAVVSALDCLNKEPITEQNVHLKFTLHSLVTTIRAVMADIDKDHPGLRSVLIQKFYGTDAAI